ncbi:DUF1236 domain-containing protein [Mesorhizobium sp.]|uniref:DUF1236 domain-containing protein n=1 Tax=Mesorhizobium sp. TaxID=1871066 RepID=UPI00121A271A|nr:DUF1236 domain-containing protein [Mesorhizobium sp.]TIP15034.1 MAG: DUF1236 domain-containing protein [Mesorhizobium sp.]
MRKVLITSMLAIGVGCGAAFAQEQQPAESQSGGTSCAPGTADCPNGSKMGGQAQGETGSTTEEQAQGKAKIQTDEQAQGKAGATTDQQAQDKMKVKPEDQAEGKAGASTERQAQDEMKVKPEDQAEGKATATTEQQAQDKAKVQTEQQTQGEAGAATEQQTQGKTSAEPQDETSTGSIENVTVEQKTEITQILKEEKVEPVASIDFDISVGVEVPRDKVRLYRLPPRIVKIVPAYESYEYFVLADGRIVIVDPDTLEIVLILT